MAAGLASGVAFALLGLLARANGPLPGDVAVERWIQSIPWGPAAGFFSLTTAFNGPLQASVGFVLLAIVIVINPRTTIFAALATLSGAFYTFTVQLIARPRPSGSLVQVTEHLGGYSFPSGHANFAVTFACLLVLCVGGKYLHRRGLVVAAVVAVAAVLAISVARMATGGHWPSDVLGGWLLAGGWLLILLSVRPISGPVVDWLGHPEAAWHAHHPNLPYTFESRRAVVARALYTPVVQMFERLGWAVRGVLFTVMGIAVVSTAAFNGRHIDLNGAVTLLESNALRVPISILIAVGIGGYALWGYVRAFLDPLRRGRSAGGLIARGGYLWSAISYSLLAVFAIVVGLNTSSTGASSGVQLPGLDLIQRVGVAVFALGTLVIVVGISQAIDGWRETFTKFVLDAPHGRTYWSWTWLGRIGLVSRAVLIGFLGGLILVSHVSGTAWSTSFATALQRMDQLPGGAILAAILGVGLVALGLHSFAAARWMRLRPPVLATGETESGRSTT